MSVENEIKKIIERNKLDDLSRFLNQRRCLNRANSYMIYLFHFIQSTGIILTAYAASANSQLLTWTGISLNMFASLLCIYENQNNSTLKKLLSDIKLIKNNLYIDECEIVTNIPNTVPTTNEDITP